MAVTHQAFPVELATWSDTESMYTITRVYKIDGDPITAIGTADGALPVGIPLSITLTHSDTLTEVDLIAVERQARRVKVDEVPANAFTEVIVTYEGHVEQVFLAEQVVSTSSEKIILSLDATQLSIGANAEGTTRLVPESTLTIIRVVPNDLPLLEDLLFSHIPALVGSVNEDGWAPTRLPAPYSEGAWLLVGAEPVRNRDSSYTITFSFESRDTTPATPQDGMGFFNFFYTKDEVVSVGGEDRTRKVILGVEQNRKIYPLAGTDTPNTLAGGGMSSFASLGL